MLRIEPLGKHHDRGSFDCGAEDLNHYLRNTAQQHLTKGISRTFVLVNDSAPDTIIGFFTLASCEIWFEKLPPKYAKKYPPKSPAAKLARLAVSQELQRKGHGTYMMVNAIERIITVADSLEIIGFFVDAKDTKAKVFYKQFGFMPLPDNPLELFLPIATLRKAFEVR